MSRLNGNWLPLVSHHLTPVSVCGSGAQDLGDFWPSLRNPSGDYSDPTSKEQDSSLIGWSRRGGDSKTPLGFVPLRPLTRYDRWTLHFKKN